LFSPIFSFSLNVYLLFIPICIVFSGNVSASNDVFRISTIQQVDTFQDTVDIVIQAYKNIGIDAHIIKMPAKRALLEAEHNNTIDAELGRVEGAVEDLPNHIMIPVPLITLSAYSYSTSQYAHISDWKSLKEYEIVTIRGFIGIIRQLEKKDLSVKLVDTIAQAIELVNAGRVDMAVLPELLAQGILKDEQYSQIQRSNTLSIRVPIYHFIHEKHKNLVPELTRSFEKLLQ
jgi:polar amino acid transport system substrate-binding protein